ncbi:unnamed protein product [Calypogeia fissa]
MASSSKKNDSPLVSSFNKVIAGIQAWKDEMQIVNIKHQEVIATIMDEIRPILTGEVEACHDRNRKLEAELKKHEEERQERLQLEMKHLTGRGLLKTSQTEMETNFWRKLASFNAAKLREEEQAITTEKGTRKKRRTEISMPSPGSKPPLPLITVKLQEEVLPGSDNVSASDEVLPMGPIFLQDSNVDLDSGTEEMMKLLLHPVTLTTKQKKDGK